MPRNTPPPLLAAVTSLAVSLLLGPRLFAETKPRKEATAGTKNILLAANGGKIVSCTSQDASPYWKVDNLIDGKLATQDSYGWASKPFSGDPSIDYPQEIVFKLPGDQPHLLTKVVIDQKTINWPLLGRGAKDVEILVSNSKNGPWTHVAGHSLLNRNGPQTIAFKPAEAKFLMLRVSSNWGSDREVCLGEVEAYETVVGTGELDELISRLEQILTDLKRYRDEHQ